MRKMGSRLTLLELSNLCKDVVLDIVLKVLAVIGSAPYLFAVNLLVPVLHVGQINHHLRGGTVHGLYFENLIRLKACGENHLRGLAAAGGKHGGCD